MRDFDIFGRERVGVYAEAVILGGDFHLLGQQIFHGMIRTVVAEFKLEGFAAEREAAELVAETNAEYRDAPD